MRTNTINYLWIRLLKKLSIGKLILILFGIYLFINVIFSFLYFCFGLLESKSFLDHFYFSIVTSFTVGYGDIAPKSDWGKIIVIVQICLATFLYAITISFVTVKIFLPKETIVFSDQVLINRERGFIGIRIINTHREPLINPEIRIFYTEHCVGNVIANTKSLRISNNIPFLGIHDFIIGTQINKDFVLNLNDAISFDQMDNGTESRFRLTLSIAGYNGIQQIAQIKKYYPKDFKEGSDFKPINYNNEDQKSSIKYSKFGDFWNDFNTIYE
jgi:hypothetical protein